MKLYIGEGVFYFYFFFLSHTFMVEEVVESFGDR